MERTRSVGWVFTRDCGILVPVTPLFHRQPGSSSSVHTSDFDYLPPDTYYLDSACQTLRPQPVIDAELAYYQQYNACGGRVKYAWGQRVDGEVQAARKALLAYVGKSEKEYAVAFTLNTTYGINMILQQLQPEPYQRIITSDIEHNSVFLPTMVWAARHGKERRIINRSPDGSLPADSADLERSIVLLNSTSNVDGRMLTNAAELAQHVHARGGVLLLDAAQTLGHHPGFLREIDFDAAFGSSHKMYGPSLGFAVLKKSLLDQLDPLFIGGGTVSDVRRDGYDLLRSDIEPTAFLEAGLQNWAGIIGLNAAITWLQSVRPEGCAPEEHERDLSQRLFEGLKQHARVRLLNREAASIVSFHVDGIDAHQLALYLSERQIMCRSGYFCCHSYLLHDCALPPLLRVSLGLNNTQEHIRYFLSSLQAILSAL